MADDSQHQCLLVMDGVTKRYDDVDGQTVDPVLTGIHLVVERGESIAISGPSGSGKSTLLNLIGSLDQPTSGRILLDGVDLATQSDRELAALRNRKIGFVFQTHHLLPQCTALENVLVPTIVSNNAPAPGEAEALLETVGLAEFMRRRPGQLSIGQRQRVAIARALVNRPILLLADEPTGSLDQTASDQIADLLNHLNEDQGLTTIVVTHAPDLAQRMKRVLQLHDGRLDA